MSSKDLKLTSKEDDKAVSKKVKSRKSLKAGDPNEVNHSIGRDLTEQAFSSQ